jgi:hypothetical protein
MQTISSAAIQKAKTIAVGYDRKVEFALQWEEV